MRPAAALTALVLALASSCKEKSDEDLINAIVDDSIAAANDKAAGGVVEHAADDFKGPGGADKREARRVLTGYFLRKGWLKVFEQDREVTVETGNRATVKLDAVIAVGKPVEKLEDLVPTNGTHLVFDLELKKTADGWKYSSARYRTKR